MSSYRVLIVEDEAIIADDLQRRVRCFGHEAVGIAATGHQACDLAAKLRPDLVFMDIILKGEMDGIQAAKWIREELGLPVVFLTSHTDNNTVNLACRTEPFGYILKPIDERELRVGIEVAIYRHRTETRIRQMERWMTTTLNSIGDGVIATDKSGKVVLMNPYAEALTGWTASEARGHPLGDVFCLRHGRTGEPVPDPTDQAMREGIVVHIDRYTMLQPRDGAAFYIDDSAAPIRGEKDEIQGAIVVFRDATARMRAEEKMVNLNDTLEREVKRRTDQLTVAVDDLQQFTHSVSHDLRAPLTAVRGYAAILAERVAGGDGAGSDAESLRLVRRIQEAAVAMGEVIEAFQRLGRVERQDLTEQEIHVDRVVAECLSALKIEERTPAPVIEVKRLIRTSGDLQLIRQVWMNLLSNALKYSSKVNSPYIEVGSSEGEGECIYYVRDNGAGFDMKQASRLFKPFQRLHASKEFAGHGVGLATAQRVIQRHGGRIWAESAAGRGATFYFALPRITPGYVPKVHPSLPSPAAGGESPAPQVSVDCAARPEASSSQRRILVVEDQAIVAADVVKRLTRLGYVVDGTAASAEEALGMARRLRPSLVLMDIQLKGRTDGIEASNRLQQEMQVPIVFVTSHSDEATFERAKATNPLGYVVKPFQDRELTMAIELALCRSDLERRVEDSQRWLNATIRSIGDGVIATDSRGLIVFMNPAAEALTGWQERDVLGRDLADAFLVYDLVKRKVASSHVAAELKSGRATAARRDTLLMCRGDVQRPIEESASLIRNENGRVVGGLLVFRDITERKTAEAEREKLIVDLRAALDQVKTLRGLLPICAWCRKVRDDEGYWRQFEDYVRRHTEAEITHSICPTCARKAVPGAMEQAP